VPGAAGSQLPVDVEVAPDDELELELDDSFAPELELSPAVLDVGTSVVAGPSLLDELDSAGPVVVTDAPELEPGPSALLSEPEETPSPVTPDALIVVSGSRLDAASPLSVAAPEVVKLVAGVLSPPHAEASTQHKHPANDRRTRARCDYSLTSRTCGPCSARRGTP
jgi:hypothetical protein